jgi:hypothetical protein
MALSNGTLVSSEDTSASSSSDSTSTPRKSASGNSCKNLMEIQRWDQKLWPFRTSTVVSSEDTSASSNRDSTFTPRQTASGNSCKYLTEIQRLDQKLCPFEPLLWSRTPIPPHHPVAIPHLLLDNRRPETPVNI